MKNRDKIDTFDYSFEIEGSKELIREFSSSGKNVMVVCERPNGTYTYSLYTWDLSDYEYLGAGYWAPSGESGIYSELDSVVKKARRELMLKT